MRKYDKEFKEKAVKVSDEVGIKQAAKQLGVYRYDTDSADKLCIYARVHRHEKIHQRIDDTCAAELFSRPFADVLHVSCNRNRDRN
jgi:hypothetical protein